MLPVYWTSNVVTAGCLAPELLARFAEALACELLRRHQTHLVKSLPIYVHHNRQITIPMLEEILKLGDTLSKLKQADTSLLEPLVYDSKSSATTLSYTSLRIPAFSSHINFTRDSTDPPLPEPKDVSYQEAFQVCKDIATIVKSA